MLNVLAYQKTFDMTHYRIQNSDFFRITESFFFFKIISQIELIDSKIRFFDSVAVFNLQRN